MKSVYIIICSCLFIFGCSKTDIITQEYEIKTPINPVQKGDRFFNIAPSDGVNGFSSTFESMQEVGVGLVGINLEWTYFEETKGNYKDPDGLLQAVGFYADNGIEIGISIATINTVKRTDPSYLNEFDYDHPEYILAFNNLVTWILSVIPDHVVVNYISVGNEIDYVLKGNEWSQFEMFLQEAKAHIHNLNGNIKVGAKMTITHGLLGGEKENVLNIIEASDIAMLNYYPQNEKAEVYNLNKIETDFESIISLVDKTIYFTEIGYQSGDKFSKSSEAKQADFYHFMFDQWDKYYDEIKFIQINWMHDISAETLNFYSDYYGSDDGAFLEYLGTLGLKNHDESSKLAWDQIKVDAQVRGWE